MHAFADELAEVLGVGLGLWIELNAAARYPPPFFPGESLVIEKLLEVQIPPKNGSMRSAARRSQAWPSFVQLARIHWERAYVATDYRALIGERRRDVVLLYRDRELAWDQRWTSLNLEAYGA